MLIWKFEFMVTIGSSTWQDTMEHLYQLEKNGDAHLTWAPVPLSSLIHLNFCSKILCQLFIYFLFFGYIIYYLKNKIITIGEIFNTWHIMSHQDCSFSSFSLSYFTSSLGGKVLDIKIWLVDYMLYKCTHFEHFFCALLGTLETFYCLFALCEYLGSCPANIISFI